MGKKINGWIIKEGLIDTKFHFSTTRWWFQLVYLLFSPLFGEDSHIDSYFSKGLVQPPPRLVKKPKFTWDNTLWFQGPGRHVGRVQIIYSISWFLCFLEIQLPPKTRWTTWNPHLRQENLKLETNSGNWCFFWNIYFFQRLLRTCRVSKKIGLKGSSRLLTALWSSPRDLKMWMFFLFAKKANELHPNYKIC